MICDCWRSISVRIAAIAAAISVGYPTLTQADEVRTFAVTVDGKQAGTYALTTTVAADGTETIAAVAAVKVKFTLLTYIYELKSTETWKGGKLISLEAHSNDNGKKKAVVASVADGKLSVTVNRQTRRASADVLTSTGVRIPATERALDAILFEVEDGSETTVRVEPLGPCRVTLDGKVIDGSRYKLTGKDVAAEWWFDANGRAIRQENKWDGYKVVFALTGIGK